MLLASYPLRPLMVLKLGVPEAHFDSDWTENEAISLDRRLFPSRSGSPRTFEDVEELEAYGEEQLVQRGATAQMIERFQLSFTETRGIIAWADQDLFDEFSGPAMKEGDFWKIHLGRRVRLDEDDLDGALFMEGLLEDAMLFSQNGSLVDPTLVEWDTRHESPGVWVTKPRVVEYADVDWDRMYEDFESSVVPDGESTSTPATTELCFSDGTYRDLRTRYGGSTRSGERSIG